MAKEKVSFDEIQKLKKQKVEDNGPVDSIDAFDRATGRILSKLGKFFSENL